MVDQNLINMLQQQGNTSQNQLNQRAQMAQLLMQGGQKTTSPIVAALSGFLGMNEMQSIADQQGEVDKLAAQTKAAEKIDELKFRDKDFAIKEKKMLLDEKLTNAQLAKFGAEIKALQKKAETGDLDTKDIVQIEGKLRDDYVKASGEFVKTRDATSRVFSAAKDPSAAGDLALIFNYMKVLDPGSTVREGEFANAENAGGVGAKTVAMYNKVLNGERLADSVRGDFVDRTSRMFKAMELQQAKNAQIFTGLSQRTPGVKPENVVIDLGIVEGNILGGDKGTPKTFLSVEDAEKANLPKGTEIMIGGRKAVVE